MDRETKLREHSLPLIPADRAFQWPFGLPANLALLALAAVPSLGWIWLGQSDPQIFREHGPMENFQAACLLISLLLLGTLGVRAANGSERVFWAGLALVYATLLLLEFDVRPFEIPQLTWILNGRIRDTWLGLLWLGALVFFVRDARRVWAVFAAWLPGRAGVLLCLAGVFWILGGAFDKFGWFSTGDDDLMAEELMDCNAALFMLVCAVLAWRGRARNDTAGPVSSTPAR